MKCSRGRTEHHNVDQVGRTAKRPKKNTRKKEKNRKREKEKKMNEMKICEKKYD